MKYQVKTKATKFERNIGSEGTLRIAITGDYPVAIISENTTSVPYIRGQSFFVSVGNTPLELISVGGPSEITVYKVSEHGEVECNLDGEIAVKAYVDIQEILRQLPFEIQDDTLVIKGNIKADNLNVSDKYVVGNVLLTATAIDNALRNYISNLESKIALLEYRLNKLESK